MFRACELKDQTYKKTRILHFSEPFLVLYDLHCVLPSGALCCLDSPQPVLLMAAKSLRWPGRFAAQIAPIFTTLESLKSPNSLESLEDGRNLLSFPQPGPGGFSINSRISKFSRFSREWTFLKRPLFQKTPFFRTRVWAIRANRLKLAIRNFSDLKRDSQKKGSLREPSGDSRESGNSREPANRFANWAI